jgi:uncharacterized protein
LIGLNQHDGTQLSGLQHLQQSVADILRTRTGTRVLRRDYGANHDLIDQPMSAEILVAAFADWADALDRFEPRFELTEIRNLGLNGSGKLSYGPLAGYWYFNWPQADRRYVEIEL